jgi:hypothetical protein
MDSDDANDQAVDARDNQAGPHFSADKDRRNDSEKTRKIIQPEHLHSAPPIQTADGKSLSCVSSPHYDRQLGCQIASVGCGDCSRIKANEVRIRDFGRVVRSTLFTADINEFMIRLSAVSTDAPRTGQTYLSPIQPGTQSGSDYALSSVWPRSRSESQLAVIKVKHVLPIRLNIHPDHVLLPGPNKEFQR